MSTRAHLVTLLLLAAGLQAPARAAIGDVMVDVSPEQSIRLVRLPEDARIVVDGKLEDAIWQAVPAYDEFLVIEPDTLVQPAHATRIQFAYDDRGFYLAAAMHQPPETRIKRLSGRDAGRLNRDSINLTLDTSGEGRYGFWFGVNLGDALIDGTVLPERKFTTDWDGPWDGRSQETDYGWSAELFIPWSAIAMPAGGDVRRMGLYLSRKVAYLDQRWGWPALPDTVPRFMSALQTIEMEHVAPRQQYNLYPFAAAGFDAIDDEPRQRIGADLFWRPSSNFQLNATVNPDFGNVESDDVVINLSATEVFFPEKRLFFLEGQEIFIATPRADTRGRGIGNAGAPYTMVNTRRIGGQPRAPALQPGETVSDRDLLQPTDLYGAVRTTGQYGRLRYGVLGAFEDAVRFDADGADGTRRLQHPGNDYGIARLLYEDNPGGAYGAIGVLSTAVLNPDRDALVTGVDGHWLTPDGRWKLDGQLMTSEIDDVGRGYGGFIDAEYTFRQGLVQRGGFEYFDRRFDMNDLGFLPRRDHYRLRSSLQWTNPDISWARDNAFDIRGFLQKNISESLFTGGGVFVSNQVTFADLSRITGRVNFFPKQYDDLNSFGNGTYRIEEKVGASVNWDSDNTRRLAFGVGTAYRNEDLGGDTWSLSGSIDWRPSDRINLSLDLTVQDRGGWLLHQGGDLMATFDALQIQPRLSLEYFLSARQQLRVSFQWVGISAEERDFYRIPDEPGSLEDRAKPTGTGARANYDFSVSQYAFQARYRWEIAPLSDIFVVYTRQADVATGLGDDDFGDILSNAWQQPLNNFLVFKVRYRLGS